MARLIATLGSVTLCLLGLLCLCAAPVRGHRELHRLPHRHQHLETDPEESSMGEPGISIGKTGIGLAIAAAPIPPPDATGGLSAYVLSSAHATDRWARMEKRLVDAHANYTKFAGIDGRQRIPELTKDDTEWMVALAIAPGLDLKELQPYHLLPSPVCANTTSSHWACTISHLMLLLEAYEQGEEAVLVLEDDMEVLRWPTAGLLASAPPDWQVLQLYSLGALASHLYAHPHAALWEPWLLSKHLYNTGAYIINRGGMRQVLDTYLPGASTTGQITAINFTSITPEIGGCHADMVVYPPTTAYFCTDLFFVEEGTSSLLALDAAYLPFHSKTRETVQGLLKTRGFRQSFA